MPRKIKTDAAATEKQITFLEQVAAAAASKARTIEDILTSINNTNIAVDSGKLDIGYDIRELRQMALRGKWMPYVEEHTDMSYSTAWRCLRSANIREDFSALKDCSPAILYSLLPLSTADIEDFISRVHYVGEKEMTFAEMSTRALDKAVKAYKKAKKEAATPTEPDAEEDSVRNDLLDDVTQDTVISSIENDKDFHNNAKIAMAIIDGLLDYINVQEDMPNYDPDACIELCNELSDILESRLEDILIFRKNMRT